MNYRTIFEKLCFSVAALDKKDDTVCCGKIIVKSNHSKVKMLQIKTAIFLKSSSDISNFLESEKPQIAIVGKSNVGKSSFINFLANQSKLARISNTPGRTRLINYFDFGGFILTDLPGYGFAKAPKQEKEKWGVFLQDFLLKEEKLKWVIVLLDIRHDPTLEDVQMLKFLYKYSISFSLIATKADKISRTNIKQRIASIANFLAVGQDNIFAVSSEKKTGKEDVLALLERILTN